MFLNNYDDINNPNYKNLNLNEYLYSYKDTTTSEKYGIKSQYNCHRKCGVYLHIHKDYPFDEYFGPISSKTPEINFYSSAQKNDKSIFASCREDVINYFGDTHAGNCKINLIS